jgi:putative ABC transport system ATP-binding protein
MGHIQLAGIEKTYKTDGMDVNVLKSIDFQIESREMVAIMGPSGSGKTTLLNIIGLIDRPTGGEYAVDSQNISDFSEKTLAKMRNKFFGFVLQDFALIEHYTVAQNVGVPLICSDTPRKEWPGKIEKVLSPYRSCRSPSALVSIWRRKT